ncbi:hypothetical protein ACJMK2_018711 [Sinanodonta woodiana]|uniref:Uncharacterized protein n=1 Tax=Sinanodonta woodiana TaxID=1069815 RepID=A0ABD3UE82_SINWO
MCSSYNTSTVDLVDMTLKPSGGYKYILHLMDHFSKFHLLRPLILKTQADHTNNGSELGALDRLLQQWPGSSDIAHGCPRNGVMEKKIAAMAVTYHGDGSAPWHMWLPFIKC